MRVVAAVAALLVGLIPICDGTGPSHTLSTGHFTGRSPVFSAEPSVIRLTKRVFVGDDAVNKRPASIRRNVSRELIRNKPAKFSILWDRGSWVKNRFPDYRALGNLYWLKASRSDGLDARIGLQRQVVSWGQADDTDVEQIGGGLARNEVVDIIHDNVRVWAKLPALGVLGSSKLSSCNAGVFLCELEGAVREGGLIGHRGAIGDRCFNGSVSLAGAIGASRVGVADLLFQQRDLQEGRASIKDQDDKARDANGQGNALEGVVLFLLGATLGSASLWYVAFKSRHHGWGAYSIGIGGLISGWAIGSAGIFLAAQALL